MLNVRAGVSFATTAAAALIAVSAAAAMDEAGVPVDLTGLLARVGERVEAYYARAQSIICFETVRVLRMNRNLTPLTGVRQLVYELHVSRDRATDTDPMPEANVIRELKTINGRPPKSNAENDCLDPNPISLDPLSFLLPHHQRDYRFSYKGSGRSNGRAAAMLDYAPASPGPMEVTWIDGCASVEVPARTTGRVWIDTATGDVLRVDEQTRGPIDVEVPRPQRLSESVTSLMLERATSSIRYKVVTFTNPDETLLLPESTEMMSFVSGVGFVSLQITHTFTGYQRFVTGARIVN